MFTFGINDFLKNTYMSIYFPQIWNLFPTNTNLNIIVALWWIVQNAGGCNESVPKYHWDEFSSYIRVGQERVWQLIDVGYFVCINGSRTSAIHGQ